MSLPIKFLKGYAMYLHAKNKKFSVIITTKAIEYGIPKAKD